MEPARTLTFLAWGHSITDCLYLTEASVMCVGASRAGEARKKGRGTGARAYGTFRSLLGITLGRIRSLLRVLRR